MATEPADTQREIERLRGDMTDAAAELRRRLGGGKSKGGAAGAPQGTGGLSQAFARQGAGSEGDRARAKPAGLAVAGAAAVAAAGYAAYVTMERWRESRRPDRRLRRRAEEVRGGMAGRLDRARALAEEARRRGVLLKVDREGDDYLRVTGIKLDALNAKKGGRKDMVKNLLWAALLAIFMAAGGVLARRVAGELWRLSLREDPPSEKK